MGIMYRCSLGGGGETCEFIAPDYDANKTDYAADDVVLKDDKVMKYNGSEWEDFSLAECTTLNSNLGGIKESGKFTIDVNFTNVTTKTISFTKTYKNPPKVYLTNNFTHYGSPYGSPAISTVGVSSVTTTDFTVTGIDYYTTKTFEVEYIVTE